MIAAATQNLAPGKMLFNWFDVALVFVLFFGFWRGRKNGMTKEFVPLVQWLATVIGGAFGYQPLGDLLIQQGFARGFRDFLQQLKLFGDSINEKTLAYVFSYLVIAAVLAIFFSLFKAKLKAKLEGSQAFGSGEYYLGMVSGVLRYACILIFALALLNAPHYTLADNLASKAFNNRWFGGGMSGYSGDFFPTLSEVQTSVFKESLAGPVIKDNLSILLVNTVAPGGPAAKPAVIFFGH
jgi:uncharacterized membrane protein required for colicin V production